MKELHLIGPFKQLLPLSDLPIKGSLNNDQLQILHNGGILINNEAIFKIGNYKDLQHEYTTSIKHHTHLDQDLVVLPGFIDAHTHICFAGSRAQDYHLRNTGATYLEIAKSGGGIWDTVTKTRKCNQTQLETDIVHRANCLLHKGITTIEVKSGYGLSVKEELKMLRAIKEANKHTHADLIATCLAAHIFPKDYSGDIHAYLEEMSNSLFPKMKLENIGNRVDAFIEDEAFSAEVIKPYLDRAKKYGFDITIHADQFSSGGSQVAVDHHAVSADHLEASSIKEISILAKSNVVATALPGASIGLGMNFAPARKILDAGGALCIASDWNPGSAPMGNLLVQAAILGAYEKLSSAEVFAGITYRAAAALNLQDRGTLLEGKLADMIAFPINDYREILYHQGQLNPSMIWKKGIIQEPR